MMLLELIVLKIFFIVEFLFFSFFYYLVYFDEPEFEKIFSLDNKFDFILLYYFKFAIGLIFFSVL